MRISDWSSDACSSDLASRSAASNASADGTRTSGCTPVPSQLPPLNGLTGEPVGTNTASPSRVATGAPALAAPPLTSPTIVARPACCQVLANDSAAAPVRALTTPYIDHVGRGLSYTSGGSPLCVPVRLWTGSSISVPAGPKALA